MPVDASPAAARAALGLPPDAPLFLCPQSLFKIHPDNDALFARVLAAAPQAKLVVFEGRHPALTARWRARLAAACVRERVALDDRLVVLPQCSHADYLRINAACDAMLDTLHWSGGNTSLDALACRAADRHAARALHARPAERRDAASWPAPPSSSPPTTTTTSGSPRGWPRTAISARRSARRIVAGAARVFDDAAPTIALAGVLEALAREG